MLFFIIFSFLLLNYIMWFVIGQWELIHLIGLMLNRHFDLSLIINFFFFLANFAFHGIGPHIKCSSFGILRPQSNN